MLDGVALPNLTRDQAVERAALVTVDNYKIELDLTDGNGAPGERTFRSVTTVTSSRPSGSSGWSTIRSTAIWRSDRSPVKGRKGLGVSGRLSGQSRVPPPPARMTAYIYPAIVSALVEGPCSDCGEPVLRIVKADPSNRLAAPGQVEFLASLGVET